MKRLNGLRLMVGLVVIGLAGMAWFITYAMSCGAAISVGGVTLELQRSCLSSEGRLTREGQSEAGSQE